MHPDENIFVSILLPTRGRAKWLCEAIDSVYSLAYNKSSLEFILKVDDDDIETIQLVERLSEMIPLRAIVSPRGNGFKDMHIWVNDMCKLARGEWIFLFNDDARMVTEGWDVILEKVKISPVAIQNNDIMVLVAETLMRPDAFEFVFLKRKVFEVLGHFSLNPHNDNWICSVMGMIRSCFNIPIQIRHFSEEATDDTRIQSEAAYAVTSPVLVTSWAIRAMIADALKLQDYIDSVKGAV